MIEGGESPVIVGNATVLPAIIDGIRAHFGNPTQITLLRMPVSAGSLHEKTVHNESSLQSLSRTAADFLRDWSWRHGRGAGP